MYYFCYMQGERKDRSSSDFVIGFTDCNYVARSFGGFNLTLKSCSGKLKSENCFLRDNNCRSLYEISSGGIIGN